MVLLFCGGWEGRALGSRLLPLLLERKKGSDEAAHLFERQMLLSCPPLSGVGVSVGVRKWRWVHQTLTWSWLGCTTDFIPTVLFLIFLGEE